MKVAISIPDRLHAEADAFAKTAKTSRSGLYARAMAEFMVRHGRDHVSEALDRVVEAVGDDTDTAFRRRAARKAADRSEW